MAQIYTDTIVFAPLSSSFNKNGQSTPIPPVPVPRQPRAFNASTPAAMAPEAQGTFQLGHAARYSLTIETNVSQNPRTRKEWIADWQANNPGRPRPCSAKAVYRLADSEHLSSSRKHSRT